MDFPILDQDTRVGTLTICREGLYTRFEAAIPARPGLQRLWLCGERDAACLGLFEPEGDTLRLSRRLSRAELKRLPAPLLHAALAEPPPRPNEQPKPAMQPKSAELPRPAEMTEPPRPAPQAKPGAPLSSAPPVSKDGFRRVTIGGKTFVMYKP